MGKILYKFQQMMTRKKRRRYSHFLVADTKKMNLDNEWLFLFRRPQNLSSFVKPFRKVSAIYNMWLYNASQIILLVLC